MYDPNTGKNRRVMCWANGRGFGIQVIAAIPGLPARKVVPFKEFHQRGFLYKRCVHELKTHPEYFNAVARNKKTFELRKDDRCYEVYDVLKLRKFDPEKNEYCKGASAQYFLVTYILEGGNFGLEKGMVIMSIKRIHGK